MVADAKDILYLVLAFCVLWFTIFVCWLLYYFIAIMREARGMTEDVREKINKALGIFESLKEKLERSLSIFSGIAEGVKYVGSYLMDRRSERRASPRRKKHEKMKEEAAEQQEDEGEE
ncbi:hypothetical protein HYW17_03095 [Candidatus Uhrbacteria bacterium]|nr:hypothetical protein [Candidatus Uhrbacteria bacterium]